VFINFWYAALPSEALTDRPARVRMLGVDVVLFRGAEGGAHALANTCVHRGASLGDGRLKNGNVQCPYHGWEFNADGQCVRIPSLGSQARIPGRARVDAYPVVERYGLVHVFLGDLPEDERPPVMAIPEYGAPGWRATLDESEAEVDYRRSLENGLDPAHNEFVHTTHGFAGTDQAGPLPELSIEESAWGGGFMATYTSPPLADPQMQEASKRSRTAAITAGTFHHGPSCMVTRINPAPGFAINQNVFKTPVDATRTRSFLVQTRSFMLEAAHDARFHERNQVVREQDRVVIDGLAPFHSPAGNQHETLLPADEAVGRYRSRLAGWEARGWRIDEARLVRDRRRVAYAIPSPGRRAQPRGWVLDPVPLVPA
jgi:phenylpropionate dioxygenase-like ring-hydroxylating dioxygenase large terminal subunit